MQPVIELDRWELVWEKRKNKWNKKSFENYLHSLQELIKKYDGQTGFKSYVVSLNAEYEFLKKFTWDEIVDVVAHCQEHGVDDEVPFYIEITSNGYEYKVNLYDIITEAIRQDNYDTSVYETDYAEDYQENWDVYDGDDEEESEESEEQSNG